MAEIQIASKLLEASELQHQVQKTFDKSIPEFPKNYDEEDEEGLIQITIKNATQFPLLLMESNLESGKFWAPPCSVPSFGQFTFSCRCDYSDGSSSKGVKGANLFQLMLDGNGNTFDITPGWAHRESGGGRASVKESVNCEKEHRNATSAGNSIFSENDYSGHDLGLDGVVRYTGKIRFHVSAAPGFNTALFAVTQVKV